MLSIRKGIQLPADFGKEGFQHAVTDTSDFIQPLDGGELLTQSLFDFSVQACNRSLRFCTSYRRKGN